MRWHLQKAHPEAWPNLHACPGAVLFPCALSRVLPPRVSEVVGVAHIKAYAFDDSVLLSGANLSNTYFSMRQDRYYVFRDAPLLAQHIRSLVQASCARKPLL